MEREWPLVSIAMPCYNRGSNLEKFIANIRKQSYPQDKLEIVLADFIQRIIHMKLHRKMAVLSYGIITRIWNTEEHLR